MAKMPSISGLTREQEKEIITTGMMEKGRSTDTKAYFNGAKHGMEIVDMCPFNPKAEPKLWASWMQGLRWMINSNQSSFDHLRFEKEHDKGVRQIKFILRGLNKGA